MGYGNATTGAGSNPATKVTVTNAADMQAAIDAYLKVGTWLGLEVTYTGTVDYSPYYDMTAQTAVTDQNGAAMTVGDVNTCTLHSQSAVIVEVKRVNNVTIVGAPGSAGQFGLHIAGSSTNIIVRNMTLGLTPGGSNADLIGIEGLGTGDTPSNIWIDHNTLFTKDILCPGAGDTSFDGMVDAKKGATNITVSYNYMHDHAKMSLNGYSDTGEVAAPIRYITFHHNLFENIGSRTPLQRFGYSHMLNNYMSNIFVSGVNVRMGGYSLVEGNYFENVQNPVTSRDSTAIGYWELRNNNIMSPADFSTYGITWVASGSTPTKDATDWATTAVFPTGAMTYAYTPDPAACVKTGLRTVAGAGKGLATLKCS